MTPRSPRWAWILPILFLFFSSPAVQADEFLASAFGGSSIPTGFYTSSYSPGPLIGASIGWRERAQIAVGVEVGAMFLRPDGDTAYDQATVVSPFAQAFVPVPGPVDPALRVGFDFYTGTEAFASRTRPSLVGGVVFPVGTRWETWLLAIYHDTYRDRTDYAGIVTLSIHFTRVFGSLRG